MLLKVVGAVTGLRVDNETERDGLDGALHGEEGYIFGGGGRTAHGESPTADDEMALQAREADA